MDRRVVNTLFLTVPNFLRKTTSVGFGLLVFHVLMVVVPRLGGVSPFLAFNAAVVFDVGLHMFRFLKVLRVHASSKTKVRGTWRIHYLKKAKTDFWNIEYSS
jgi:hypothetical protein